MGMTDFTLHHIGTGRHAPDQPHWTVYDLDNDSQDYYEPVPGEESQFCIWVAGAWGLDPDQETPAMVNGRVEVSRQ